jgi:hypothetical protein
MTLRVIGTGFGRTGTDSMRVALDMLGFGPTHHMKALMEDPAHRDEWRAMALGGDKDWHRLFAGFGSCVDWPSAHYWRELAAAYPDAKLILTWRSPESWWESFEKTILGAILSETNPQALARTLIDQKTFGGRAADRDHAIAVYNANVEAVRSEVPRERLFIHELGSGWDGLCAHLGVAVPSGPFPSGNTTTDFLRRAEEQRKDEPGT